MKRTPDLDRRAYAGNNMRNKTVGIVGIGHIGRRVAELCGVAVQHDRCWPTTRI